MIHLLRCEDDEDEEFQMEDFDRRLKALKTKCKDKYQFILKAGEGYKEFLFKLFSKVWVIEEKPQHYY